MSFFVVVESLSVIEKQLELEFDLKNVISRYALNSFEYIFRRSLFDGKLFRFDLNYFLDFGLISFQIWSSKPKMKKQYQSLIDE